MSALQRTVGQRFATRLTGEVEKLIQAVLDLTSQSGWDVDRRKVYGALPHDLRQPDGWDILHALEALRIPYSLDENRPPEGKARPILMISPDATWSVHSGKTCPEKKAKAVFASVLDVDAADLNRGAGAPSEIFSNLRPTLLSLLLSSLVVNLLGIATVVFVILIYNFAVPSQSLSVLIAILVGIALFALIELAARSIRSAALVRLAADMEHQLGLSLVYKLMSLPLVVLQGSDVFQQRTRLRQFEVMRDALLGPIGQAALDFPFMLLHGAIIFILSPLIGALLIGGGILALGVFALLQSGLRERSAKGSKSSTAYRKRVSEAVENQSAIRGLGVVEIWENRVLEAHLDSLEARAQVQRFAQTLATLLQALVMLVGVSAGVLAVYQVLTGVLSLGSLVGIVVLIWRFLTPLQSVAQGAEQLQSFLNSKQQFEDAFTLKSEHYRGVEPKIAPPVLPPVVFDQVTLRFQDSIVPPLLGVSLKLDAGSITSLSGPNMSGKTKLAELIAGLYAPTGGQILINGADVRQIPVDDLRAGIAYAPQTSQMLYGSIAQNFDFALPGCSEDEMWRALLEAGIEPYVRAMPEGLRTRLTTDSFRRLPSGVQKGLGLAQCFLKPGPVFIFDDPLFGMEPDQNAFVRGAIRARRARGTVLLISNQPGDLDLADRHIFLDKGRVVLNDRAGRGRPRLEALIDRL